VNNAGCAVAGLGETVTSEQVLAQLNTNVVGAHRVNRAALPGLRERPSGLIVHVSSTQGRLTTPLWRPWRRIGLGLCCGELQSDDGDQ
jgi:NAD(P)-dependent dehydrogenase (short-subunit alcohol dehydrogenase family)